MFCVYLWGAFWRLGFILNGVSYPSHLGVSNIQSKNHCKNNCALQYSIRWKDKYEICFTVFVLMQTFPYSKILVCKSVFNCKCSDWAIKCALMQETLDTRFNFRIWSEVPMLHEIVREKHLLTLGVLSGNSLWDVLKSKIDFLP